MMRLRAWRRCRTNASSSHVNKCLLSYDSNALPRGHLLSMRAMMTRGHQHPSISSFIANLSEGVALSS